MNASDDALTHTFQTSMAAGTYDDVVGGGTVEVAADGSLEVTVPAWGAVAIHK
jgi:alpha-amylase